MKPTIILFFLITFTGEMLISCKSIINRQNKQIVLTVTGNFLEQHEGHWLLNGQNHKQNGNIIEEEKNNNYKNSNLSISKSADGLQNLESTYEVADYITNPEEIHQAFYAYNSNQSKHSLEGRKSNNVKSYVIPTGTLEIVQDYHGEQISVFSRHGADRNKTNAHWQTPETNYSIERRVENSYSNSNVLVLGRNDSNYNLTEEDWKNSSYASDSEFGKNLNRSLQDSEEIFDWKKREDSYRKSRPEEFPFSVLLILEKDNVNIGFCTGSLITEEWVLTASHCLYNPDQVIVYAGGNSNQEYLEYYNETRPLPATAQVRYSSHLFVHPNYTSDKYDFDIGLIKVKTKFNMTDTVKVVELATVPWNNSFHSYQTCILTGFGIVQLGETRTDDLHRKTHILDVKNPCICSFRLQMVFGVKTASRYICTRPKRDYGVCPGDSGGGLICQGKIRAVAMQIINLRDTEFCDITLLGSIECGSINTLSVFQDTCPFLPWINSHVKLFKTNEISSKCHYVGSAPPFNSGSSLIAFTVILIKTFLL